MPEILVHHLNDSRSQRILWLLEELALPYEIVVHQRDSATMRAPAALRKLHPLGKAPLVVMDGVVLAESGAIIETIVTQHGPQLAPKPGTDAARLYRYWLHYAEGSLAPPLLVKLITSRIATAPVPFFLRPMVRRIAGNVDGAYTDPEIKRHLDFIDDHLARHAWFSGDDFSGADIQMSFGLEASRSRAGENTPRKNIGAWLAKVATRPAYATALDRGGPYRYAA